MIIDPHLLFLHRLFKICEHHIYELNKKQASLEVIEKAQEIQKLIESLLGNGLVR